MHGVPAEAARVESAIKTGTSLGIGSDSMEHRVSVAPMMDWTDRHCRYFLRGFSPRVLLYTEMITAAAVLRGNRQRLLGHHPEEHPLALQLGGSDPDQLARAARIGEDAGYDEVNLNCGCPSDRVSAGAFGACLMQQPGLVADCVAAMRAVVRVPVTVKLRIGVVEAGGRRAALAATSTYTEEDFARLLGFSQQVIDAGATALIVHARKAVLGGLSPKDNREVPPLRFDVVQRLRAALPHVPMILNGGLRTVQAAANELAWCDGVMLGREAYHRPQVLADLHRLVWPADAWEAPSRSALAERMATYAAREIASGARLSAIARHALGLYAHEPGAREFRRLLSEGARAPDADASLFSKAAQSAEIACYNRPAPA
ncbi:MAG: tRNA-dihydrouridine(20/20a) synthase [Steroidobacteraceae bacterium]|nr:tRNA-dihydrouridine(20/20a) synthase [Steroidobacteraceae bacterium]